MSTLTALDLLVRENFSTLKGKRIALLAHAGSVSRDLHHALDIFAQQSVCTLVRVFGPEHGLRGAEQAMDQVGSGIDPITKIPVVSLYGTNFDSLKPKAEHFRDIDTLVIDLPDVGSRYYTYAQTMALCMEVAGANGVRVLVLDRPNPIGGVQISGAPLQKGCRSFCGLVPVANRHGLTIGELARAYNQGFGSGPDRYDAVPCALEVRLVEGWRRSQYFDALDLPWILPSPNIPTLDSAIVYPGGCLFEATNISEGRGTTRPFEFLGAPYIDGARWADATLKQGLELAGAKLRPITFIPKFEKCANELCGGVQIHVTDRATFEPFRWNLALIAAAKELYPNHFAWRQGSYEFVDKVPAIDLLYGSENFRIAVESGRGLKAIENELSAFEAQYRSERSAIELY